MKRITNLNTISTYLDRLIIECVKKAQFETKLLETPFLSDEDKEILKNKIEVQLEVIQDVKQIFSNELLLLLSDKEYEFYKEERTFTV